MITDTLTNLEKYKGMHKNLDTAIDFIQNHSLAELENGKHVVDGENVFVNVMDADLRNVEVAKFEFHYRYADLQIDLTGSEGWEWSDEESEKETYDPSGDVGFQMADTKSYGVIGDGRFVLFVPGELHKPGIVTKVSSSVHKAVVKILME